MSDERNYGGPAFPAEYECDDSMPGFRKWSGFPGMSLRDYFAAKAMLRYSPEYCVENNISWSDVASKAYQVADAMLKERARS